MCTVEELIKTLQTLPPHTIVKVIEVDSDSYSPTFKWVDLKLTEFSDNFDYIDLKNNPFAPDDQKLAPPSLDLGCT